MSFVTKRPLPRTCLISAWKTFPVLSLASSNLIPAPSIFGSWRSAQGMDQMLGSYASDTTVTSSSLKYRLFGADKQLFSPPAEWEMRMKETAINVWDC